MPCNVALLEMPLSLSPLMGLLQLMPLVLEVVVLSNPGLNPLHITACLPWGDEGVKRSQDLREFPTLPRPCC